MFARLAIVVLVLCSGAAQAGPVDDWYARDDAALVIVLLDGLVADLVNGCDVNGRPLMPSTAAWVDEAMAFTDVLAHSTEAREARGLLRGAIETFGAEGMQWVRDARDLVCGGPGRQVAVIELDWLGLPLQFDEQVLAQTDPAPWIGRPTNLQIEGHLQARRRLAQRAADLGRGRGVSSRDLRWVVGAAHASIDERLAALLGQCSDERTAVLLTATSSIGMGERKVWGSGIGASLDVARVPVYLRVPGLDGSVDTGPRQWIDLRPGWVSSAGPGDRYTWAVPAEGASGSALVCEVRWTTADFTLLDSTMPRRPPRLFDLELDREEWFDRAVEYPALADSLQRHLRAELYGVAPVVAFRAGEQPVMLALSSVGRLEGPTGRDPGSLRLEPGEVVRVRMPDGAENIGLGDVLPVRIGGDEFLLAELTVHSTAWRAALREPFDDPLLTIWIE